MPKINLFWFLLITEICLDFISSRLNMTDDVFSRLSLIFSGKITQPKVVDPRFPEKQQHDWRYYTCVSVTGNLLRVHTHNTSFFKVPYQKASNTKNDVVLWGECNARWSLTAVHLISVEHWHWIHQTVRIPCLAVEDPNRKVPDLYFKVMGPKLQVADLKAEVGELRSGGIPPI